MGDNKETTKGGGYQTRIVFYDRVTGEELEGTPVYVAGKAKWRKDGWFVGFQDAFGILATDKEMTGEVLRVWMHLMSRLGFENFIVVEQKEIAVALTLQKTHISRSIKILVEKGLLIKGPKIGRSTSYRLSLDIAWKGSAKEYNKNIELSKQHAAKELAKQRWKVFEEVHRSKQIEGSPT